MRMYRRSSGVDGEEAWKAAANWQPSCTELERSCTSDRGGEGDSITGESGPLERALPPCVM